MQLIDGSLFSHSLSTDQQTKSPKGPYIRPIDASPWMFILTSLKSAFVILMPIAFIDKFLKRNAFDY